MIEKSIIKNFIPVNLNSDEKKDNWEVILKKNKEKQNKLNQTCEGGGYNQSIRDFVELKQKNKKIYINEHIGVEGNKNLPIMYHKNLTVKQTLQSLISNNYKLNKVLTCLTEPTSIENRVLAAYKTRKTGEDKASATVTGYGKGGLHKVHHARTDSNSELSLMPHEYYEMHNTPARLISKNTGELSDIHSQAKVLDVGLLRNIENFNVSYDNSLDSSSDPDIVKLSLHKSKDKHVDFFYSEKLIIAQSKNFTLLFKERNDDTSIGPISDSTEKKMTDKNIVSVNAREKANSDLSFEYHFRCWKGNHSVKVVVQPKDHIDLLPSDLQTTVVLNKQIDSLSGFQTRVILNDHGKEQEGAHQQYQPDKEEDELA
ncbi:TPA: hypothetical protein ACOP2N_004576 [Salmonella enterica]